MSDSVLLLRRVRERSSEAAAAAAGTRRKRGRRRRFYPEHRVYRARSSFLDLSEEQVLRRYRLDKAAIAGLCSELGSDLESLTGRSHALPVAVKVTSALTFLASGSFQTATRDTTGISQSAMSNCLAQFLEALQRRAARYIAFPAPGRVPGPPAGPFPGVLGLLGSMHVALRAPSENELAYRNARNYHSMNMQVVCDARGTITNVVAKYPGSCPNAAVLENSALARLLDGARLDGAWLLARRRSATTPCTTRPWRPCARPAPCSSCASAAWTRPAAPCSTPRRRSARSSWPAASCTTSPSAAACPWSCPRAPSRPTAPSPSPSCPYRLPTSRSPARPGP
ncbi:putative nuclease HARBI1 isoform X3 [Struthio camelus]|uniref:putative nuclease HARBI1 isoform X3 n=1 Tax=Struthio camelus TaxID=8801 RepID=UPI003603DA89